MEAESDNNQIRRGERVWMLCTKGLGRDPAQASDMAGKPSSGLRFPFPLRLAVELHFPALLAVTCARVIFFFFFWPMEHEQRDRGQF